MAVEIKELVIKAVIAPGGGAQEDEDAPGGGVASSLPDKQELIQACVEQVLKILKREKNR